MVNPSRWQMRPIISLYFNPPAPAGRKTISNGMPVLE
jgi:hypothetical protein